MKNRILKETFSDKVFIKNLLSLALPIAFQSLMLSLVGASDTIMLGSLNQSSMAAVSLATQLQFIQNLTISGIVAAFHVLGAQYSGKEDKKSVDMVLAMTLRICILVSILTFLVCYFLPRSAMRIFTNVEELLEIGVEYLKIASFSYLIIGLSQCFLAQIKLGKNTKKVATDSKSTNEDMRHETARTFLSSFMSFWNLTIADPLYITCNILHFLTMSSSESSCKRFSHLLKSSRSETESRPYLTFKSTRLSSLMIAVMSLSNTVRSFSIPFIPSCRIPCPRYHSQHNHSARTKKSGVPSTFLNLLETRPIAVQGKKRTSSQISEEARPSAFEEIWKRRVKWGHTISPIHFTQPSTQLLQ